ncbi:MAG: ribulose-phosphate 3-epimerase [Cyclobacteriaceae bacterium]|nr:ribulose-phosphate 3-epimerase [Cyclobacteriaceae bacterium HetDA_MAG_MS6]
MSKRLISPSVLAADFGNIQRDIEMLNQSEADYIHIDIMDGVFVPNISFGFSVTSVIQQYATKPLDFHLMIADPNPYLKTCRESGAEVITVHSEGSSHLHRTIHAVKDLGAKAGVALNPHSPVSTLKDIVQDLDLVLIMSVNPGFGGQHFIPNTYKKVKELRAMADSIQPELIIEVDGGVNLDNAKQLYEVGANMLVAGSAVFGTEDPAYTISKLKSV